jgi:hypothetical protein
VTSSKARTAGTNNDPTAIAAPPDLPLVDTARRPLGLASRMAQKIRKFSRVAMIATQNSNQDKWSNLTNACPPLTKPRPTRPQRLSG